MLDTGSLPLPSILVVDDDPGALRTVSRLLAREGYSVTAAHDVASATQVLEDADFAVILTDFRMPGRPGVSLVEEVERRGLRTPVILMSGSLGDLDPTDPRTHRLAGVVAKPIRFEVLRRLIPAAIRERQ